MKRLDVEFGRLPTTRALGLALSLCACFPAATTAAETVLPSVNAEFLASSTATEVRSAPGAGFEKGTFRSGLGIGLAYGPPIFGTNEPHDLVLSTLQLGWMPTGRIGEGHFYRGNLAIQVELLGGWQYHPEEASLVSLTPMLRYTLATGTRWNPFIEAGAGIAFTDIGRPDLSTEFEFRSTGGVGVNYHLSERLAVSLTSRFAHFSNAGIDYPNNGVNEVEFLLGISHWF